MKHRLALILLALVLCSFASAQTGYSGSMPTQEKKDWISANLGVGIIGDAFSYNPATGALEISGSTRATIPENFKGTVEVKDGGTVIIKENFQGGINVNNGNVELAGKGTFKGAGKYSALEGFTVTNGEVLLSNGGRASISNAGSVSFGNNKVSGRAGKNALVNNQFFGENAWFTIDMNGNLPKLTLIGNPGKTTLPNGDIKKIGSKYYIGNMELDTAGSFIYLKAGDKMKFEGKTLFAKNKDLLIYFEVNGRSIKPFFSYYQNSEAKTQVRAGGDRTDTAAVRWADKEERGTKRNLDREIMDVDGSYAPISEVIKAVSAENGVEPNTALALISVESNGRTNVVNYQGRPSYGLGQITEIAVDELNAQREKRGLQLYDKNQVKNDPAANARASIEYYSVMLNRFYGNEEAAIVAYNYGEGKASQYYPKRANDNTDNQLRDSKTLKAQNQLPTAIKLHIAKFREFKKRY